jgi:hypothetical protein
LYTYDNKIKGTTMAANKQTTIRVDSWLAEALAEISSTMEAGHRLRKPTMSIVISRLVAKYNKDEINKCIDQDNERNGVAMFNGVATKGDIVMAITGQSAVYTVMDIIELEHGGKALDLFPKDKWTEDPIHGRTAFFDYAILKRGVDNAK